jgi:hypothetical protein
LPGDSQWFDRSVGLDIFRRITKKHEGEPKQSLLEDLHIEIGDCIDSGIE